MNGWRSKVPRSLAAITLGTCTTLVALPATPSAADTNHYIYTYECLEGRLVLRRGPKTVKVQVSIPKTVQVGKQLVVEWTLSDSYLITRQRAKAGGKVSVTGTVKVGGLWQGQLDSLGSKDQAQLEAGDKLVLPTAISGAAATSQEGKLTLTPGDLTVDFVPAADDTTFNNTRTPPDGPIVYSDSESPSGGWTLSPPSERSGIDDIDGDVHYTTTIDDKVMVTFTGTGLQYITERHREMGEVQVELNDRLVDTVDASKEEDGTGVAEGIRRSQQVLWQNLKLPYRKHTATFTNLATDDKYMLVDAFRVVTDPSVIPSDFFTTTCHPIVDENPTTATVDVVAASNDGDGSNNGDGENNGSGQVTDGDDSARGVIVLSGGGQGHGAPTATATATATAKPKKTPKASPTPQVRVTPKGGARTGEAPDRGTAAPLLIGYGAALALAGVAGGVLRRRRGAAGDAAGRGDLD